MGFLKSIGKLGKKVLGGIGDAAKFAAPALNFVPGVGPLAAAAAGGLGGVLGELNDADGFNLGQGLGAGALSALSAYGAGRAKGALSGRGAAAAGAPASAAGAARRTGLAGIGDTLAGSSGGGWGNVAGDVLGFARKNPGLVLGGIGAVTSALGSARNDSREREALQALQADYEARRGLRGQAVDLISRPLEVAPDLSHIFDDPGNPYRRARRA
jgi:hypothetical protein